MIGRCWLTGYAVELLFGALGLIPSARVAIISDPQIALTYTSVLNVAFLAFAAILFIRAARTGVGSMLKMMGGGPDTMPMAHH